MEKEIDHIEGKLPKGYTPGYTRLLFNSPTHRQLQSETGWRDFYLVNRTNQTLLAEFHCCISEEKAINPYRAPYGGLEFDPGLSQERLHHFVGFICDKLREQVRKVCVRPRPSAYGPVHFSKETYAWLSAGFQVGAQDAHAVMTTQTSSVTKILAGSEVNRLNKCRLAGFRFENTPLDKYEEIHAFTLQCRKERGQSFSMSVPQLGAMIEKCPEEVMLFSVYKETQLTAAAICMRVGATAVYNFSHAHLAEFDDYSPVVFLIDGIFDYCKKNGIEMIDLGSSSLEYRPNFPLLAFKERLGSCLSLKLHLEKDLR